MSETIDFDPFDQATFTYDKCFLCGDILTNENTTDEHVYPKWLQSMFNLWNKEIILLNQTSIKYKWLKIPCCKSCNGKMSTLFERPIQRTVSNGYNALVSIDKNLLFLWLNKMAYGMLFKELSLDIKRDGSVEGKIMSEEYLKNHRMQFMFLQTILSQAEFLDTPYSILIFKINPCGIESYWAHENPFLKTFFIRMNDIGIISHLMDNGYNEGFFHQHPHMEQLLDKELHPIQFAEICAKFAYKCSLFNRNPSYTTIFDKEKRPSIIISHSISGEVFDDWSQEEYARALSFFWQPYGMNFDQIYQGEDKVLSYLLDNNGSFIDIISEYDDTK